MLYAIKKNLLSRILRDRRFAPPMGMRYTGIAWLSQLTWTATLQCAEILNQELVEPAC